MFLLFLFDILKIDVTVCTVDFLIKNIAYTLL